MGYLEHSGINVLQQMTLYATTMLEFNVPGRQSCSSSDPAVLHIHVFARDVFFVWGYGNPIA